MPNKREAKRLARQFDAVRAFQSARDHVLEHAPAYWKPPFRIDQCDDTFVITTAGHQVGGNAEIIVEAITGTVRNVRWNPM